jgi:outer membrane protein OmpA-like peptidoglycan-associated protein
MLTNTAAGSCVVSAARAMSPNYLATTSSDSTITVSKKDQSLAFTTTIPSNPVAGGTYSPKATATSGLEVAISITSGENTVCSLGNGVVTFIAAGSCVITGRQAGNANFNPADAATQTIAVGSMNQTISFTQPAEKRLGDPAFQLEASSSSGLSLSFSVTGTACSVSSTGLTTLLAPGTCDVTASSAADSKYGAAAAVTRTIVVRAGLPGVPHLMSASPSDSSIIVAYSTPPTDGGSPIVSYVVVAAPATGDPITRSDCSTVTLTCELVGLTNGMGYTVKVAAVTAAGVGDYSAETDPVTPFVAPEAVRDLTGVREEQSLLVAWEDPDSLGGGTLLRYDVSIREKDGSFGAPVQVSATNIRLATVGQRAWNHTFRNLSKAKVYEVKVVTVTSLSATSTPANTAQALVQRMNVAEAPRNLAIEATSETSAVATWATPLRDGGSPITSYSATSTNGTCAAAVATSLSCSMTNLTPGKAVTVTVKAVTVVGSSEISTATISLPSRPAAPTIESVTRKGTSATITWKAPASDGGRAVTSYRINGVSTLDSKDAPQCSSTSLTCTVEGLAMSAAYNFTAKAFNSLGEGATSSAYFAQAFSAVPAVWGSLSDTTERIAIGLPPAPGSVKVLSSSARRSSVIAMAPKTTIPITHAIITVAGAKGRVVLRVKVAVNQSNPQAAITIPYSSRSVSVAVQFANAFGVSAMTATGWKPATQVTRLTDAASNVQRGVTATKMVPIGSTIGAPVYFIGASSQLSSVAKAELARIAAVLKRDGGIVNVTGYARYSPDTSTSFMKKVSDQRALVVANYLATLGVQQWIRFQGVGAPTTRTGPDTDRRVVVSITPFD